MTLVAFPLSTDAVTPSIEGHQIGHASPGEAALAVSDVKGLSSYYSACLQSLNLSRFLSNIVSFFPV